MLARKGRQLFIGLIACLAVQRASAQQCPNYPQDTETTNTIKQVWDKSSSVAGGGNGDISVLDIVHATGGGHDESRENNTGTNNYDYHTVTHTLITDQGKLAAACGVAICNLKQHNASEDFLYDFNYLCFGGNPDKIHQKAVRLDGSVSDLFVSQRDLGRTKPWPVLVYPDPSTDISVAVVDPSGSGSIRGVRQTTKISRNSDPTALFPVELNVKIPLELRHGKILPMLYQLKITNGDTLNGAIQVQRSGNDTCQRWAEVGPDVCLECVIPIKLTAAQGGAEGKDAACPHMRLGSAVSIYIDGEIKISNVQQNQYRAMLALWVSPEDPNNVDRSKWASAVQDAGGVGVPDGHSTKAASWTVPSTDGKWGAAGTVDVQWELIDCYTINGAQATCDVSGEIRIEEK